MPIVDTVRRGMRAMSRTIARCKVNRKQIEAQPFETSKIKPDVHRNAQVEVADVVEAHAARKERHDFKQGTVTEDQGVGS